MLGHAYNFITTSSSATGENITHPSKQFIANEEFRLILFMSISGHTECVPNIWQDLKLTDVIQGSIFPPTESHMFSLGLSYNVPSVHYGFAGISTSEISAPTRLAQFVSQQAECNLSSMMAHVWFSTRCGGLDKSPFQMPTGH